jgi:hypothetical protein
LWVHGNRTARAKLRLRGADVPLARLSEHLGRSSCPFTVSALCSDVFDVRDAVQFISASSGDGSGDTRSDAVGS